MRPSRQSGVSLIELMIGLVIGLMVVIASMGSLVYTRAASRMMTITTIKAMPCWWRCRA